MLQPKKAWVLTRAWTLTMNVVSNGKKRTYSIPGVFERRGRWFIGYSPTIPGINVQERTLTAARESFLSAARDLVKINPSPFAVALVEKARAKELA